MIFHMYREVFTLSRNPPSEEMMSRTVYGPKRLLNIDHFSEHIVVLLEREGKAPKPEDPRLKTIQTVISEYVSQDPEILRLWSHDDIKAEQRIRAARATLDQVEATASEISAVMTDLERVRS